MSSQSLQISVMETLSCSKFHLENFFSLGIISNDSDQWPVIVLGMLHFVH